LIALAIAGKTLLPIVVIAIVAVVCAIQVFLDIYQGRPAVTTSTDSTTSAV